MPATAQPAALPAPLDRAASGHPVTMEGLAALALVVLSGAIAASAGLLGAFATVVRAAPLPERLALLVLTAAWALVRLTRARAGRAPSD